MDYTVDELISIIFDAVEDLVEIAELDGRPYSPDQIVDIGYIILSKNRISRSDIRKWTRRPDNEKTWPNFILLFTEAHQDLKDIDATVDKLGFHSANSIIFQIVEQLRNDYTPSVETRTHPEASVYNSETSLPIQTIEVHSEYTDVPTAPTTNTIQKVYPAMATLMSTMMSNIEFMRLHIKGNERQGEYGTGYHNGRGRRYGCRRGRGRTCTDRGRGCGRNEQHRWGKYCHTHGNSADSSTECETTDPDHKTAAAFADMMGGRQNNCA